MKVHNWSIKMVNKFSPLIYKLKHARKSLNLKSILELHFKLTQMDCMRNQPSTESSNEVFF